MPSKLCQRFSQASTISVAVSAADGGRDDDDAFAAATIILVADLEGGGFNVEIKPTPKGVLST